jgi:uncharacterized protein YdeI (YjbR/CyaY-like superfamily)
MSASSREAEAQTELGQIEELPIVLFGSTADWEAWLEESHAARAGVWLKIAKKGSAHRSVTYAQALEVALCFGWIDSQKRGFDEQFFLQRFTPRRPRGKWSRNNRETVQQLIAAGRMRPAGFSQVEAAKADGRWDAAYEGQHTAQVPAELQRELDANPTARASSTPSTAPTATRSSTA